MSLTNSLPTWIWVACIILWCLTIILMTIFRVARKRALRHKNTESQRQPAYHFAPPLNFNTQMHHELWSQQIDTVFNAMSAVIETERLKLKALLGCSVSGNESVMAPSQPQMEASSMVFQTPTADPQNMGSMVEQLHDQGLNQEQIAAQLGVSQSEVALVSKMIARQADRKPVRLNAVA